MTDEIKLEPGYEKCNFKGCDKILKLPEWKITPGSIQCIEHGMLEAPWTDEQVVALNHYQQNGPGHPFTGERHPDGSERILIATNSGWIGQEGGPVIQTWAWKFMAKED